MQCVNSEDVGESVYLYIVPHVIYALLKHRLTGQDVVHVCIYVFVIVFINLSQSYVCFPPMNALLCCFGT